MPKEKLVRDRIPEIVRRCGRTPQVRVAAPEELDRLFREKILEEAQELLQSGADEEIVDVIEAVEGLVALRGIGGERLQRLREEKRSERGAFEKGLVMEVDGD